MDTEIRYAAAWKPHYILIHYPKPVLIDDRVDWSAWRFADETEFSYESTYRCDMFEHESKCFFKWISDIGSELGFTPVLELDAVNQYIYRSCFLEGLLEEYPNVRLCLDIGRIHLQDCIDPHFDGYGFVGKFAKYAELIHLWNVQVDGNVSNNHYPALPSQRACDGWADVERYFEIITKENHAFKVLFEHRSELITDRELDACYEWIAALVKQKEGNLLEIGSWGKEA